MFNHVTVLLNEAVEGLNVKPDGIYVDCTLGGAGHSSLILKQLTTGHLYCFDQDIHAIEAARERLEKIGNQFTIIQSNFAYARRKGGHPAKRTFQALRIAVNDELNVFDIALKDALDLLNLNGRISVITFHSLEDKICKYTFNEVSKLKDVPKGLPVIPLEMQPKFKLVNRKPIIASDDELTHNHRAHSAKLRVIERVIL